MQNVTDSFLFPSIILSRAGYTPLRSRSWNFSFILHTYPSNSLDRYRTMLSPDPNLKINQKGRTVSRYIRTDEMMSEFSHGGSTNGVTHFFTCFGDSLA
jgi:hypothetical protein